MADPQRDHSTREPEARARSKRDGAPRWLRPLSIVFRVLLGVIVLAAGVGVYATLRSLRAEPETHGIEERALLVRTIEVREVDAPRVWEGFGTARPMSAAEVSAQVAGRVVERPERIEPGAAVAAGELLVRIEPEDFAAALEAAEQAAAATRANLEALRVEERRLLEQVELQGEEVELARNDVGRIEEAMARGAGMQRELDAELSELRRAERSLAVLKQSAELIAPRRQALEAQLQEQRARISVARLDLARTEVTSPIAGFVQRVDVEEGELVSVGAPVARVVDLRTIEVPLALPASSLASVGVGDAATLRVDGARGGEGVWEGRVTRVAPEADPATRTLTVFVEVRQDVSADRLGEGGRALAGVLLPGRFVMGEVRAPAPEARVIVPRGAVVSDRVLVAEGVDGSVRARLVPVRVEHGLRGRFPEIDPAVTEWAVLAPGSLPAGARVIVTNLDQLGTGTLVRIQGEPGADAGVRTVSDGEGEAGGAG